MVALYAEATNNITTATESFLDEVITTGQSSLGHTTTTTTTGSEDYWFVIQMCGIAYFVLTAPVIGGLFVCFKSLRKSRMLRRLYPKYEGVTQVNATVTNKRTVPHKKGTYYYLSYTFTGTHPGHGPFRVTRQDFDINDKRLFDGLEVGSSVPVSYNGADPENCAPMHYIEEIRNKKTTGCVAICSKISLADILFKVGLCWLLAISNMPFYYLVTNLQAKHYSMGALAGFLALACLALGVGLSYGIQQICLHSRRKFTNNNIIIKYREDIAV